jgi:hypothetical protein
MVLQPNNPAYFDTFAGLVPVTVTRITGTPGIASTAQQVEFTVTKTHGPYKQGEQLKSCGLHVCPVAAIRRTQYSVRIRPYTVEIGA